MQCKRQKIWPLNSGEMQILHVSLTLKDTKLHIDDTELVLFVQYAFNLFSHNSPMTETGYNEEEMKMVKETKKIWGTDDVAITATCIRVPIMRAHAESINLELNREVSEDEVILFSSCISPSV